MPSRLKEKKLHESASSRGHFLQILQSKPLAKVTVGSHRGWYHQSVWALMHRILCTLPSPMYTMQTWSANLEYAKSTNLKCWWMIRICVSCKFQIWPETLQHQHVYCQSPNLAMNWQYSQIDLHISTLQMHCECICVAFKFGAVCRDMATSVLADSKRPRSGTNAWSAYTTWPRRDATRNKIWQWCYLMLPQNTVWQQRLGYN